MARVSGCGLALWTWTLAPGVGGCVHVRVRAVGRERWAEDLGRAGDGLRQGRTSLAWAASLVFVWLP